MLGEIGGSDKITCGYHGWQFSPAGVLVNVQDPDDFPDGNPCGKVTLTEVRCETWGPFIFYCMDEDVAPLLDWLAPLPERLASYGLDDWIRVMYLSADADFNWKIIRDNFNESYHLPTIHPELSTFINDGLSDTVFEMYETGHNSMWMKGHQASTRNPDFETGEVPAPLDDVARAWGLDPADYNGHTGDIREAIVAAKRRMGPEIGYTNYENMSDQQLVDYFPLHIVSQPHHHHVARAVPDSAH